MIETSKYVRKPFYVDAVQVSAENMNDVAAWCSGDIQASDKSKFIKVDVAKPISERQTMAFAGDWILSAGPGFKVYTNRAFQNSFEAVNDGMVLHASAEKDYRDAHSGRYVTEQYADENPGTTVSETSNA
jgi:hypothetical protein